jgi:PTH1 family peptidyl-tRNA hydrolase
VKLVVGLGNPGPRYEDSRHNVGFRIVDQLARDQGVELREARFCGRYGTGVVPPSRVSERAACPEPLAFLEPLTFMNRSGEAIVAALAGLPEVDSTQDLLVVYDDLDLPLGRIRVRPRGGAGGHNGLADVIAHLGSREFARLRFGIGRPAGSSLLENRQGVVDFVLDGFEPEEQPLLSDRIPRAAQAALVCLRDGASAAMDRFNADPDQVAEGKGT